jgi:hypothetical protein
VEKVLGDGLKRYGAKRYNEKRHRANKKHVKEIPTETKNFLRALAKIEKSPKHTKERERLKGKKKIKKTTSTPPVKSPGHKGKLEGTGQG